MKGAWPVCMQNEAAARGEYIVAFDTANEVVAVGVGRIEGIAVKVAAHREVAAHRASNTILLSEVDAALAGYREEIAALESAFSSYAESDKVVVGADLVQLDYTRLFIGSFKMYAPPYASFYTDGADQIFGPTAVAVEDLYAQFGLQIKDDEHDMPDHIRYLLTFMALLAKAFEQTGSKDAACAYEDFKQEFLDPWSAQFSEKIHTYTDYGFFKSLIDFTLAAV